MVCRPPPGRTRKEPRSAALGGRSVPVALSRALLAVRRGQLLVGETGEGPGLLAVLGGQATDCGGGIVQLRSGIRTGSCPSAGSASTSLFPRGRWGDTDAANARFEAAGKPGVGGSTSTLMAAEGRRWCEEACRLEGLARSDAALSAVSWAGRPMPGWRSPSLRRGPASTPQGVARGGPHRRSAAAPCG